MEDLKWDVDFLLCIGDGKTDEVLFNGLNQDWQYTITVGRKRTDARYCVDNVKEVDEFLNEIAGAFDQ